MSWRHARWRRRPRRGLPLFPRLLLTGYLLTTLALAGVTYLTGRIAASFGGDGRKGAGAARRPDTQLYAHPYGALIQQAAAEQGLDPVLVVAVIEVESGFNPAAVSSRGARGLMQIIPSTWRELNPDAACPGNHPPPAREPGCIYDPAANVTSGTRYLRRLLNQFDGDVILALAAYNAGQGAVERAAAPGEAGGVPAFAETQRYTELVLDRWAKERVGLTYDQARGLSRLLVLARWLLAVDVVVLGLAFATRPAWAGEAGRWGR